MEDQQRADERIPHLLATPAAVRFLSLEPLLGPVDLAAACPPDWDAFNDATAGQEGWEEPEEFREECEEECDWVNFGNDLVHSGEHKEWLRDRQEYARRLALKNGLHWCVIGGESGSGARPCHLGWIRSLVEQCKAAKVPAFVKQAGSRPVVEAPPTGDMAQDQRRLLPLRLRDRKGGTMEEWPDDLPRVREFPKVEG